MLSIALVYFMASKISSNFFLRVDASLKGHKLSSWWQKMTFSRMALDTPRYWGMIWSSSATRVEMECFSPSLIMRSEPSRVFWLLAFFLTVTCMLRVATMRTPEVEPFQPTMRVSGAVNWMVSPFSGPKERMPCIIMRSILDMMTVHAAGAGTASLWVCGGVCEEMRLARPRSSW